MTGATDIATIQVKSEKDPITRTSELFLGLRFCSLSGILMLAVASAAIAAEDTARGTTASSQPHPELEPTGIQKENFVYLPSLAYTLNYDDNVFSANDDKESSYLSVYSPSVTAVSTWSRHSLSFGAVSEIGENHSFSSEDYTDWEISARGELEIRQDIKISAGLGFGHDHVDRTAPDDSRGIEPTEFDSNNFNTRYSQRFGRVTGAVSLNRTRKEYDDVEAISLGVPFTIDNSIRDRTEYILRMRAGFNYVGDEQVFVMLRSFDRDYDKIGLNGRDKSSTGLETSLGASFDYYGIFLGEVSLGYRSQEYKNPLPDIDTPLARASIRWNLTDLTTLSFTLDHSIRESIDQISSGYESRSTTIALEHELRRDLLLSLSIDMTLDDYETISPAERDDKTYSLTAGTTYKMNRNLYFNIQYAYLERESDIRISSVESGQFDFRKNLISIQLLTQF